MAKSFFEQINDLVYEYTKETLIKIKEEGIEGIYYWESLWIPGKNIHEEGKSTRNEWANAYLIMKAKPCHLLISLTNKHTRRINKI